MARGSSSGVGRDSGRYPCTIIRPGHGRDGGRGSRDRLGEKMTKYNALLSTHFFVPLAIKTLCPINITGQNFISDLGRSLTLSTGDNRDTCFLLQRLSITIQYFNSVAFLGTLAEPDLSEM